MMLKFSGTKLYTYVLLMIIIPGLILIGISVISITKQKTSRILDLNKELSAKAEIIIEEIEEKIEKSFSTTLSKIKNTDNFKNFIPESYINFFKKIMFENQFITYPFVINSNGEYIFPIQQKTNTKEKLLEKVNRMTALDKFIKSNKSIEKDYTDGEKNEFENKNYLSAIKSYLNVLGKITDPLVKAEILYAISRCYRQNENFNQAIAYLDEIIMMFDVEAGSDNYLEIRILYDKANCYDKLDQRSDSISIYIDLYDRILKFEKLTKRNDYSSLKAGVLQYLEKNIKKIEKFREDFEKMKKDDGLSGLSDIELELNWSYLNIENILRKLKETNLNKISKVERFRLNRIKEFYLSSDNKTVYYRKLLNSDLWLNNQIEPLSINSKIIKNNKDRFNIIYSKVNLENQTESVYFGYWISLLKIKSELFPDLILKHFKKNNLKLDIETSLSSGDLKRNMITFSDFKKYIPDTRLYIVSNKENYINETIKKELILNYLIVIFLLLMLIFGIIFFIRIFNKEQKLLRMKSDFVDSVSHTLKTPLTRIRLITEKLELGWTKDKRSKEEMLRIIQTETDLMSESIENMLSFSKIDSGKLKYRKNPLDMAAYLKELIANYESYLNSKGFTIEIKSETIPIIPFDREAFKLIFINLMQNSIKYSMEEKEITIELLLIENKIVFKVADRGIGISAKCIDSVFDKFFRADDNLVKTIEGSGLGLFLVKHAVDAHNGEIIIKNREDGGLEVEITFPIRIKVKK